MTREGLELDPEFQDLFAKESAEIYPSAAPVSEWAIVQWCRALGDTNLAYVDDAAAREHGHGGTIAPPIMMYSFTMPAVFSSQPDGLLARLRRKLAQYGLNSVLAASYDQEFLAPIHVGDRLTRTLRFESISEEKVTGAGPGRFVMIAETFVNQRGEHVGNQKMRVLFFEPARPSESRASAPKPKAEAASEVEPVRYELPPLSIPLTTTLIVAGALASNDFESIHHDREAAKAQGLKDIIMNVLSSTGLAMRYATDWAGPAAVVKSISSRLKAPNYPGDTMTLTGWADQPYEAGKPVEVHVRGSNAMGGHIDSVVRLG